MITLILVIALIISTVQRLRAHGKHMVYASPRYGKMALHSGFIFTYRLILGTVVLWEVADPAGIGLDRSICEFATSDNVLAHAWLLTGINAAVLATLFVLKQSSFHKQLNPATIPMDAVRQTDLSRTLVYNSLFYAFIFLSPTLPFVYGLSSLVHHS